MRYLQLASTVLIIGLTAGCASIVGKSGPESVIISSSPDAATISITDETGAIVFRGATPTVVSLEKKKGYFSGKDYIVSIRKAGYTEQLVQVRTRASGWYIGGNLLFGGLIGYLVVDPLTGAMWTFDTNAINTTLTPSTTSQYGDWQLKVVMLEQVPGSLRDDLVPVSQ